jgi:prepilin-type N-terminal cleavage/methylation domain-containing protein
VTHRNRNGFTLIELLVVIAIIAVLLGFIFPVFQGVQDRAKKVQAKNDLTQIVTAVNAYYTEYGQYPLPSGTTSDMSLPGDSAQEDLMDALRGTSTTLNSRLIVFLSPPNVRDTTNPRSGIGSDRKYYDPWGTTYFIAIDGDYDNVIPASKHGYTDLGDVRQGVITWSYGKDKTHATAFAGSDDVISWQ